jgi:hypothetical protein
MPDRIALIRNIKAGDFFHAESPNGASMICLATAISDTAIHARRITSQDDLAFDRNTGIAEFGPRRVRCTINSVAPLPPEIHSVFLGLDHRYRTSTDPHRNRLTDAEKRAILFLDSHYPVHPI